MTSMADELRSVPTLDEISVHPERVAGLKDDERRRLVSRLAALIVVLESGPIPATPANDGAASEQRGEHLLIVAAAAERGDRARASWSGGPANRA